MSDYKELYREAVKALKNAYAPYSGFRVGAALLTSDGRIFHGVNIENASYGATICAERSAVAAAVTAGSNQFEAIAVASSDGEAYPCGICRQVIFEFGDKIKVITGKDSDSIKISEIQGLLPEGFRLEAAKEPE